MDTKQVYDEFIAAHRAKDVNKIAGLLSKDLQFTTLLGCPGYWHNPLSYCLSKAIIPCIASLVGSKL